MIICIPAQGDNLDAQTDERFGRCLYFIIYDDSNSSFEAVKNEYAAAAGGAGVQAGQLVVNKHVDVILAGNPLGPKAAQVVTEANIKMATGFSGMVKSVIEQYKSGLVAS
ncbi:MAG: dinitrogenase iron-molybdenum cofactor biosynthesis protein [Gammaproteobacteria bacterium]|nr:dinitrogenase iron-molybdenum cofactor biosynthesis protein [Gammaproteobacteria bacterium]